MTTDRIRALQERLGVKVDGDFGPETLTAVEKAVGRLEAYQRAGLVEAERSPSASMGGAASAVTGGPDAVSRAGGPFPATDEAFSRALSVILRHEGGYVNHPRDPGGRTNLGVTQRVWEAWTGKEASEAEMRALTSEKVAPVYRRNYWDKLRCDDLPPGLALCVFDFGVNAGPARAARYLQKLVGAAQDGAVGPATIAAVKDWVARVGDAGAVREYQAERRGYYRRLSTFATFGRGWLRRVDETEAEALEMAR